MEVLSTTEFQTDRQIIRPEDGRYLKVYRKIVDLGVVADDTAHVLTVPHGISRPYLSYLKVINCWQYAAGAERADGELGARIGGSRIVHPDGVAFAPADLIIELPAGLLIPPGTFYSDGRLFIEVEYAREEIDMLFQSGVAAETPYISWIPGTLENPVVLPNTGDTVNIPVYIQVPNGEDVSVATLDPVDDDGSITGTVAFGQYMDAGLFMIVASNVTDLGYSTTNPYKLGFVVTSPSGKKSRRYFYVKFTPAP